MVLDYLLTAPVAMGVAGAAVATGIGACIPAVGGLVFFAGNRGGLRFSRPSCTLRALGKAMFNGSSEMVTNLAGSLTTLLFNLFMMRLIGSQGVAAITVVLYSQFLLSSLFLGFSMGVAPVLSYNLGAGNRVQLKDFSGSATPLPLLPRCSSWERLCCSPRPLQGYSPTETRSFAR